MKPVNKGCWPDGRPAAVTFSFDDGCTQDRRLVEILSRYGLKGTFNLNSSFLGDTRHIEPREIKSLFSGHEVATHFTAHPHPTRIPREYMIHEVMEDRRKLEELAGAIVDGMAYPYGDYDPLVIEIMRACGIRYSRTTRPTNSFATRPENWLAWHPTCHERNADAKLMEQFFDKLANAPAGRLLYIWGHSYEFDREGGWQWIENLCKTIKERGAELIWPATNRDIMQYVTATEQLLFSADCSMVENPSGTDVWVSVGPARVRIPAGQSICL